MTAVWSQDALLLVGAGGVRAAALRLGCCDVFVSCDYATDILSRT